MRTRKHSRDRQRTVWTREMDRYFLDLMLEQVGKGNKIDDHLFSRNAWKDMDTMFHTKFKLQYENDVLKNRHKTLRNLYRFVKNLLNQRGFSWDERRQMVTADNNVWDEYIKAHPEARSYRIKTIPYYSDLCSIFSGEIIEGKVCDSNDDNHVSGLPELIHLVDVKSPAISINDRTPVDNLAESSSHSGGKKMLMTQPSDGNGDAAEALHKILVDEDYGNSNSQTNVVDAPEVVAAGPCTTVAHRTRTYWQPPMDRYFIELMLDQVQKGNQVDGLFCKEAWMEMITLFNAKFGFTYDVEILKNRYKTMRRQYNAIQDLLELDGFIWDETREMVTADDFVWQDYIKTHADARQYMTRPIPYYKDLLVICQNLCDDDQNSMMDKAMEVNHGGSLKSSQSLAASASNDDQLGAVQDSYNTNLEDLVCDQRSKRALENPLDSAHPNKATKKDESMANAIWEMAAIVSSLAGQKKDSEGSDSPSIEQVVQAVQALPEMDGDLVLDACDYLEDEKKAKTFLALDIRLRKKWLMRKLRANVS